MQSPLAGAARQHVGARPFVRAEGSRWPEDEVNLPCLPALEAKAGRRGSSQAGCRRIYLPALGGRASDHHGKEIACSQAD